MEKIISKSKFKPHALEYFRQVQKTGQELIITDHAKPVLKIVPYSVDHTEVLKELHGSILKYENPTEPVAVSDWDVLK